MRREDEGKELEALEKHIDDPASTGAPQFSQKSALFGWAKYLDARVCLAPPPPSSLGTPYVQRATVR